MIQTGVYMKIRYGKLKARYGIIRMLFLFLMILLSGQALNAQPRIIMGPRLVTGQVYNQKNEALSGAAVLVLNSLDSTLVEGGFSDDDGYFSFMRIFPGEYILKVTYVGYKPLIRGFHLDRNQVNFGKLLLEPTAIAMDQVNVVDSRIIATVKGDTAVYNTDNFHTAPDATAEDLMKKVPGATIEGSKVSVQGEEVKKVLVDNRPFFGNDPSAALKNIPAEIIQQVSIYDEQSEQAKFTGFDDGNTSKAVNLTTKAKFKHGAFGDFSAGAGDQNRYAANGKLNLFRKEDRLSLTAQSNNTGSSNFSSMDIAGQMGGVHRVRGGDNLVTRLVSGEGGLSTVNAAGLNYTRQLNKNSNLTASYFFNSKDNNSVSDILQQSLVESDSAMGWNYDQNEDNANFNHRFNMRLDADLNENNSISVIPSGVYQQNTTDRTIHGVQLQPDGIEISPYSYTTEYHADIAATQASNYAIWKHKFSRVGRTLSVSSQINQSLKDGNDSQINHEFRDAPVLDSLDQQSRINNNELQLDHEINYTEPLSEYVSLQLSYEPQYSISKNDKHAYSRDASGAYSRLDTLYSSVFESRQMAHEGGVGLRFQKDAFSINGNLSLNSIHREYSETFPTTQAIPYDQLNVFGSSFIRYKFDSGSNLRMMVRMSSLSPSLNQLQETPDLTDPLNIKNGNSALGNQVQTVIHGGFHKVDRGRGKYTFFMMNARFVQDYIGNSTILADRDTTLANGISLMRGGKYSEPVNMKGYYSVGAFTAFSIPLGFMRSNLNMNVSANYSQTPSLVNGEKNLAKSPSIGLQASLSSNVNERIDFTLSSNSSYRQTTYTLPYSGESRTFQQKTGLDLYWNFWSNVVYRNELSQQFYRGMTSDYNQSSLVDNMSLGVKFLKNRAGELTFAVYDLFNQSDNIDRTVTDTEILDVSTNVVGRYALLSFSYNFRRGNASNGDQFEGRRHWDGEGHRH